MADEDNKSDTYGEDRSYDPDTPQANRNIQQGGGVGARDLSLQADPTREEGLPPGVSLEDEEPSLSADDRDEDESAERDPFLDRPTAP